jgi:hypothetical protein
VLQVDGKGNLIEGAYTNAVYNEYKGESLKALAKKKTTGVYQGSNT